MPLFPAFLQLVLKAEGIRSNPNFPLPGPSPTSHGWSGLGCSGEQGGTGKLAGGGGGLFVGPGYSAPWIPSGES